MRLTQVSVLNINMVLLRLKISLQCLTDVVIIALNDGDMSVY